MNTNKMNLPFSDAVQIYNSGRPMKMKALIMKAICTMFKTASATIRFDNMNVQGQKGSFSCGLYAIAFATELVYGYNPIISNFDDRKMRDHLIEYFEKRHMSHFPTYGGQRRIHVGMEAICSTVDTVFLCMQND